LNCEKCGKKSLDKNSSFCAYCGVSINSKPKNQDFLANAGLLSVIAAAFSVATGVVGFVSYQSFIDYYSYYGVDASSGAVGFLLFTGFVFVSVVFGFIGGAFSLMLKRFKLTILGTALMCASAVFTLITVWHYGYGYSDGIVVSVIPTLALSLTSFVLLVKSKKAFFDYTEAVETSETSVIEERIEEAFKD